LEKKNKEKKWKKRIQEIGEEISLRKERRKSKEDIE